MSWYVNGICEGLLRISIQFSLETPCLTLKYISYSWFSCISIVPSKLDKQSLFAKNAAYLNLNSFWGIIVLLWCVWHLKPVNRVSFLLLPLPNWYSDLQMHSLRSNEETGGRIVGIKWIHELPGKEKFSRAVLVYFFILFNCGSSHTFHDPVNLLWFKRILDLIKPFICARLWG